MRVTLARSPAARQVEERQLELAEGSTVWHALQAAGWLEAAQAAGVQVAVWGRKAAPAHVLREGDRIELLRPLKVDPKVARRERFRKQGARAAGLFAKKRPGGKPGY